ncbi:hypothetical protein MXD95_024125 [Frankia sp. AiPa1]|nr:hypothetical protein [Frankia sp. AiPa1]MCL9762281.1 hypothetical protein [Frankia sp. AiPa1]
MSRTVQKLERRLGVVLLRRRTRRASAQDPHLVLAMKAGASTPSRC